MCCRSRGPRLPRNADRAWPADTGRRRLYGHGRGAAVAESDSAKWVAALGVPHCRRVRPRHGSLPRTHPVKGPTRRRHDAPAESGQIRVPTTVVLRTASLQDTDATGGRRRVMNDGTLPVRVFLLDHHEVARRGITGLLEDA